MLLDFWESLIETAIMMGIAITFAVIIGIPLGIGLFATNKGMFWQNRFIQNVAGTIINIIRSIPYIILLVVLLPFTKLLLNTTTEIGRASCRRREKDRAGARAVRKVEEARHT